MEKNFKIKTWTIGQQIDLTQYADRYIGELFPLEAHVKQDGAKGDKTSVALVLRMPGGGISIAQISADTLTKVIEAIRTFEPDYMR
jgi:hypothetical protein